VTIEGNGEAGYVSERRKIDSIHLILSIDGALGSNLTVDITFGEEIHDLSSWIYDWGASDPDTVRDICTLRVGTDEWRI